MKKLDPLAQALAFFDSGSEVLSKSHNDPVPAGFFTAKQIAQAKGASWANTKTKLDGMVAMGLAERREFRIGNKRPAHYKFLTK